MAETKTLIGIVALATAILFAVYIIFEPKPIDKPTKPIVIENERFNENESFNCGLAICSIAQSFIPETDIKVEKAGAGFINGNGTIVITIRSNIDSNILASTDTTTIVRDGWTELPLQEPITLKKGTQYFLRWDTVVSNDTLFPYTLGNTFPHGSAWVKTSYGWTIQTTQIRDTDMTFRIVGSEPSSASVEAPESIFSRLIDYFGSRI